MISCQGTKRIANNGNLAFESSRMRLTDTTISFWPESVYRQSSPCKPSAYGWPAGAPRGHCTSVLSEAWLLKCAQNSRNKCSGQSCGSLPHRCKASTNSWGSTKGMGLETVTSQQLNNINPTSQYTETVQLQDSVA